MAGVASAETSMILMIGFCEKEHVNPFFYPRASWNRTFSFSWLKEGYWWSDRILFGDPPKHGLVLTTIQHGVALRQVLADTQPARKVRIKSTALCTKGQDGSQVNAGNRRCVVQSALQIPRRPVANDLYLSGRYKIKNEIHLTVLSSPPWPPTLFTRYYVNPIQKPFHIHTYMTDEVVSPRLLS